MSCKPHVAVDGSLLQPKRRDIGVLPSVLCGKCWRRVHPFLDVLASIDDAAIRRHRHRRMARRAKR